MQLTQKQTDSAMMGAICLLVGFGGATLLHECCHIAVAASMGFPASLGPLTLSTGSVYIPGYIPPEQTAIIAVAGSLGLLLIGVPLALLTHSPYTRMIGVVVLCRAWIDALPLVSFDGALMAQGTGLVFAWGLAIVEILLCGGVILYVIRTAPEPVRVGA